MDTTKKNNTECHEKYEQLISYTNLTRKKFEKEYKKLCDEETKTKEFYLLILNELMNAISKGDIESFKKLDILIGYINDIESKATLKAFYNSEENPIKNSNLVILACKYSKVEILKYIFSSSEILNSLAFDTEKNAVACNDRDISCHNAFYYSIQSNNVELLDTLINKWPNDYFAIHSEQLDEVLSSAYEELKLKNISLSDEIQIYIEDKLINFRFFSDEVKKDKTPDECLNNNLDNVKKRIELVLENIHLLTTEYPDMKKIDDKFLFVIKFIAQNIHILKGQLKSTYDKIPWEEIEFCLITCVASHVKQQQLNLFYRIILNKRKLLDYLACFARILGNEKEPELFTHLPKGKRSEIVAKIISNYPEFEELYSDYQQIRDICSLEKMKDYTQLASSIDPEEIQGQLIIIRILQVAGEHLQNSLESPKLSDLTSELLLLSLPKNRRRVLMGLRDSLSRDQSLVVRIGMEKNMKVKFFTGLQNDIEKIGDDINNILHKEKMKVIKLLVEKLHNANNLDEVKEVAQLLINTDSEFDTIEKGFQTIECGELEILIAQLNSLITERTEYEQKLFDRIQDIINALKGKWINKPNEYAAKFELLEKLAPHINNRNSDKYIIRITQFFLNKLENIFVPTKSFDFEEIAESLASIFCSVKSRTVDDDSDKMLHIILKIFFSIKFETNNVKWIEGLRTKLTTEASPIHGYKQRKGRNISKEKYNDERDLKLSELSNVLTDNKLMDNSIENLCVYKNDKRLQSVIEMHVLDIMSILGESYLENNLFFLDDNSPVLTGKCLRNHLAHDYTLTDILLSDPSLDVLLNARKFLSENMMDNRKKLGKSTNDDYTKVRDRYSQNLITVVNQQGMFAALEEGNFEDLESCLRQGADVHARNTNLWTALHFAAKGADLEIMKFLLSHDLDINIKNVDGQTPLHVAAANGSTNIVEYFVEVLGCDAKDADNCERTPLHIAAQNNHKDIVQVLLKNRSKANVHDQHCYMPLHYAVMNNCIDVVKIFMQFPNFNINQKILDDFTILHEAVECGYAELVNLFLENKAYASARNEFNVTPLHLAAFNGRLEIVNALISKGASVNARNIYGYTPLHYAIECGHKTVAKVLLKCGADANAIDKTNNNTPLHYAAAGGYEEIILDMLKHEANGSTVGSVTPLHLAAKHGHLQVVNILIDHGVDVHAKDEEDATALYRAAGEGHKEIVELLLKRNADLNVNTVSGSTPLHAAVENNQKEVVNFLIENKARVNAADNDGRTPLHYAAASSRNNDIIELLTRNGAEVNVKDNCGATPLHIAACDGYTDNAILLIESEADVNTADTVGSSTPLHVAVQKGHKDFVALLVKYNADVNMRSSSGTPLDLAILADHKEIVEILLANGAVINDNTRNPTPFVTAVKYNQKEIVELVINRVDIQSEGSEALVTAVANGYREIVEILLTNEVPIDQEDNNVSLLHLAAGGGHKEVADALISRGANVNTVISGVTPLHLAAQKGYNEIVERLILNGAKINAKSNDGTPLHLAAARGHSRTVKILLDNQARTDVKDKKNKTALELAVANGCLEAVKIFFFHKKVDMNTEYDGLTLLHVASQEPSLEMVKYLVDKGADVNVKNESNAKPVHLAVSKGFKNIVEYFLGKGLSVNECGTANSTLLHYAVQEGRLEVVKYLIAEGADVNARTDLGMTPLHLAVERNYKDIARVLLRNGAMYNALNKMNDHPSDLTNDEDIVELLTTTRKLFEAARRGDTDDVDKCLEAGAIVNAKNVKDVTSLHYAAWKGHEGIVGILLENAANPNVFSNGFTPLHYAAKFSHFKIVKLLLSKAAVYNATSDAGKTPLDLATDENIIYLLKLISTSFEQVKRNNAGVIDVLHIISNLDTIRAIMNARDEDNRSLVVAAIHSNFSNVERLKEVSQGDISYQISSGLRLGNEGNFIMGLDYLRQALATRRTILGADNPGTLDIELHIAKILYKQDALREALAMSERVFQKLNELLGPHNNDTLDAKAMVGLVLHRLGRNEEAYNIYQEVCRKQKEMLGPNHPTTLLNQFHMALVLVGLGRYGEALDIDKAVLKVWKGRLVEGNLQTLHGLSNVATILTYQRKYKDALKILEGVLNSMKSIFGSDHTETLRTMTMIADIIFEQSIYQKAMKHFQELLSIQEIVLGPNNPETLNTHHKIINVLCKQCRWISALKACRKIVPRLKSIFLPNHHTLLGVLGLMQTCYLALDLRDSDISDIFHHLQEINTAANDGDVQTVQRLVEDGVDINETDAEGRTPLHYAASTGQINVVNLLLNHGADVDVSSNEGDTTLHVATFNGHSEVVDVLLQHVDRDKLNKFVNAKTVATGSTSLHVAAENGFLDIVCCLLGHGAIYNIMNKKGKIPSDLSKHQSIVDLLETIDELFTYAENGNNEMISKLRVIKESNSEKFFVITNTRNDLGYTLLQVTTRNGRKDIAKELLKILQ